MTPEEAGQVADLVRERRRHAVDMASWRRAHNVAIERPEPLQVRMDNLSQENPRAAVGLNICLTLGLPVCIIDGRGEPITNPTSDPEVLLGWWDEKSPHALRWPGIPTGPRSGLFGLALDSPRGWEWLKRVATIKTPGRRERVLEWADRASALGVPAPTDDWDRMPEQTIYETRPHSGQELLLVEVRDLAAEMRVSTRGEAEYRRALMHNWTVANQPLQSHRWLVWRWVGGLPPGRKLTHGARALSALPARDALLDLGENCVYRVQNFPGSSPWLEPPPEWLAKALLDL
jgi:hypothetical protein